MNPAQRPPRRAVRVLVVDDSALVRKAMTTILAAVPDFEVEVAPDAVIAEQKIRRARPDVILLDLHMPRIDGMTFLRQLMARDPIPVIVCSALTGESTANAFVALDAGAVEVVAKPQLDVRAFFEESSARIIEAVRAAAAVRTLIPRGAASRRPPPCAPRRDPAAAHGVIALGASTGGTEAIRAILSALPADGPGVVVVQHMPEAFTGAFARHLAATTGRAVREAVDGLTLERGAALVAPGNRHMTVHAYGDAYAVTLDARPHVNRHRPSVDVLFHSVAAAAGPHAVGVILTGMGDDGAAGLGAMRAAGARTLAQDEASCAVFGMPRAAIERGAADEIVPLARMAERILAGAARWRARRVSRRP